LARVPMFAGSKMKKPAGIIRPVVFVISALLAFSLCSCGRHSKPIGPQRELTIAERNFEITWQASQDILKKYRFELDRLDRREGVIFTEPMVGKHFGEFWRHDDATMRDTVEGTIQTIYRRVVVTIRPTSPGARTWKAMVAVTADRSDKPAPQITTTSEAYNMFVLPGGGEKRGRYLLDYGKDELGKAKGGIVELGPDKKLAAEIEADISRLVAKRTLR